MKIIEVIDKPYIIQAGNGVGLYRCSYMYIDDASGKQSYGGRAFYYKEDAERFLKNNQNNNFTGWIEE